MRSKRLVGARVKRAGNLIDEIRERHRLDKKAAIAATPSHDLASELRFFCTLDRGIADTPLILFRNLRQDSPGDQFPLSRSRRKVPLGLSVDADTIQGKRRKSGGVRHCVALRE
jgi:hypothetical protein